MGGAIVRGSSCCTRGAQTAEGGAEVALLLVWFLWGPKTFSLFYALVFPKEKQKLSPSGFSVFCPRIYLEKKIMKNEGGSEFHDFSSRLTCPILFCFIGSYSIAFVLIFDALNLYCPFSAATK